MVKLHFLKDALSYGVRAGEHVWFDVERAAKLVKNKVAEVVEGELPGAKAAVKAEIEDDAKDDAKAE